MIRLPDRRQSARVTVPVELGGLAPTIFALLGIEKPAQFHIQPVPLKEPASTVERYAYTELVESQMKVRLHDQAIVNADSKLLVTPGGDFVSYDLRKDPRELQPLPEPGNELRVALTNARSGLRAIGEAEEEVAIDDATKERLHGLGYFPDAE
jgi:arylsulfatase A-like enzyme